MIDRCTSASSIDDRHIEVAHFRQFKAAGLMEMALRIYANPEQSMRLLGERIVPALG